MDRDTQTARVARHSLVAALAVSLATPAALALDPIRDTTTFFGYEETPTVNGVDGLAFSRVAETNGIAITGAKETSCTRLIVPFCDRTGTPVDTALDLSRSGVTIIGQGVAGGDEASTILDVSSDGSSLPLNAGETLGIAVRSLDWQLLRFDLPGAAPPPSIEVDVTYSLKTAIDDRSTFSATTHGYFTNVTAGLGLYEADTLAAGQIYTPLTHVLLANAVNPPETLSGAVETVTVKPNTDYWVILDTQSWLQLRSNSLDPGVFDFAGLDLTIEGYADPVFSLNQAFADAYPDVAAALAIERTAVVPLPASLWLMAPLALALPRLMARRRA